MKSALALAALLLGGCAVDTELGLVVTIRSASATVAPSAEGDVVGVRMDVEYRVGAHAQEAHEFRPQAIELYDAGEALVASISPDRPPGFVPLVSPGVSRTTTLTGASRAGSATAPRDLCGAQALLLFRWVDVTTGEIGTSEAETAAVACE